MLLTVVGNLFSPHSIKFDFFPLLYAFMLKGIKMSGIMHSLWIVETQIASTPLCTDAIAKLRPGKTETSVTTH